MFKDYLQKISRLYHEYPRTFWVVIVITFIDRIGGSLLFPFFALYITSKFNVGMTDVGVLFAAFSLSSFAGSAIGGALTIARWRVIAIVIGTLWVGSIFIGFAYNLLAI